MSITFTDTLSAAKHVLASATTEANHAVGTAKHAAETAKEGADSAVASAKTTWLDGVKAVASVVSMLRGFQANDALGWVGLSRRRSPLAAMGIFGAGMAVGAGAALLFAPMSGEETRRRIVKGFSGLKGDAKSTADAVATEITSDAKAVSHKVEEVAAQAKGAVIAAEHKIEDGAVALKDLAASKVDAAVQAVKGAAPASNHDASKPVITDGGNGKNKSNHPS
jgi:gas vesicle protein